MLPILPLLRSNVGLAYLESNNAHARLIKDDHAFQNRSKLRNCCNASNP